MSEDLIKRLERAMKPMLASSCFGNRVCPLPPCECAQSIVDAVIEECAEAINELTWLGQRTRTEIIAALRARAAIAAKTDA